MPLVGDVICRVRNAANDPCQTLGQPVAPTATPTSDVGIFNGTIYFIITFLTQWGESVGSSEVSNTFTGPVTASIGGLVVPYAATAMNVYFGAASGAEEQFIQVPVTGGVTTTAEVGFATDTIVSKVPPYKSSAYLPDSDGDLVSVYEIYRWMNAGLVQLGRLVGGILDQTGVAMPAGNAEVVIPGWWLNIEYTWHNGWLVIPEKQSYTWLQSTVTGIPGISTLWRNGAQQVLGTWPQPSTAPSVTQLTLPMGVADTLATVANTADFFGNDGIMNLFPATILNSASGGFSSTMAGLNITVTGAGLAGANLVTTIATVISANQLQLTDPALTAVFDTTFEITGSGAPGFTSPGMCQIDGEIMSYSQSSATQLTGIIRGYSGTIPTAHAEGATVSQLIFRLLGRRMPVPISVGQSANTLDLPQGWDTVLDYYLLSYFKQTEQNVAEAKDLLGLFNAKALELRDDQIPLQSKQVGGLYPLGGAANTLAEIQDTVVVE